MPDLGGVDSTRFRQGIPQGFQTLILDDMVMKSYGVSLDLTLVFKILFFFFVGGGGCHPLKICLWSIMIDSKILVKRHASCSLNQGGYGPKVPHALNFHLDGLQTLVSSNSSPIMCLIPLLDQDPPITSCYCFIHVDYLVWFHSFVLKPIGPRSSLWPYNFHSLLPFHDISFGHFKCLVHELLGFIWSMLFKFISWHF